MPSVIKLTIDLDANLQGIDRTIEGLKKTEAAGQSLNKALKTNNVDQMKLALERAYQTDSLFNGEVKASTKYVNNLSKAMKNLETAKGNGQMFSFTGSDGMNVQTDNLKQAYAQFSDLTSMVQGNASTATSISKNSAFDLTGYYSDMEKDAKVTSLFNGQLDVVNQKMASLQAQIEKQTRVNLDLGDLNTMETKLNALKAKKASLQTQYTAATNTSSYGGDVTEQTNAQSRYNDEIGKTNSLISQMENKKQVFTENAASIDNMKNKWVDLNEQQTKMTNSYDSEDFFGNLDKQSEGIRMFGTELNVVQNKMAAIKSQGMKLVSTGGDREEIKKLATEYRKLETQSKKLSAATSGTGTRIKNLIKNFVSAQLIVWLIRSAFTALTNGIKESTEAASAAIETANLFNTTFAEVSTTANNAAATMAKEFGLAFSTAQNAIGVFGDLAIGFGESSGEALAFANSATKAVMDLVSFKNITTDMDTVLKGFSSGLAGNNKNFKQYGVIVKESAIAAALASKGLDKLTGTALEAAKMQERLNIVIKQSPNSVNDMVKTFNSAQNVQRRYQEGMLELKQNIGSDFLPMFTKIRLEILKQVSAYNLAIAAKKNYADSTGIKLLDTDTADGIAQAKKALLEYVGKLQGTWTFADTIHSIDIDNIEEAARAFGVSAQFVYDTIIKSNDKVDRGLGVAVTALDVELAKERAINKEIEDRNTATSEYIENLDSIIEKISTVGKVYPKTDADTGSGTLVASDSSAAIIDQMISDFVNKAPKEFASGIAGALANIDLSETLGSKNTIASSLYDSLSNAMITHTKQFRLYHEKAIGAITEEDKKAYFDLANGELAFISTLSAAKQDVADEYSNNLKKISAEDFNTQMNDIGTESAEELKAAKTLSEYTKKYGSDKASIYAEWDSALQGTLDIKNQLIANNVPEKEANDAMEAANKYINSLYEYRIDMSDEEIAAATKVADEEERQARSLERQNNLLSLREDLHESDKANNVLRRDLATPYGESNKESALRKMNNTKADAQITARESLNSLITDDQRKAIKNSLGKLTAEMYLSADEVAAVTDIKKSTEVSAELTYQQDLKDARNNSLDTIEGLWEGLGDVGMVKGIKEIFESTKDYAMSKEGGSKTESEAALIAAGQAGLAVLLEFASSLDSVTEALSMVSEFFDMIGPVVDEFLAPLLLVISPILQILSDLLLPLLDLLFPIIQSIGEVLIIAAATVQTFTNIVSWAGRTLNTFTYNIRHPFKKRDYDNLADETAAIWIKANSDLAEIANMEIDTRVSYVSDLTDAQNGEIDAYKEMYEKGLLNLDEYFSLRNDVTGGNETSEIEAFAAGGNFITNGPQLIKVGDNASGKEHVIIEPLSSSNSYASLGNTTTASYGRGNTYSPTFYITSDNPKEVARKVEDVLVTMNRRGESYAS